MYLMNDYHPTNQGMVRLTCVTVTLCKFIYRVYVLLLERVKLRISNLVLTVDDYQPNMTNYPI